MMRLGFLTFCLAILLAAALPVLFGGALSASLVKLAVPPDLGLLIFLGILIGAAIDVPLLRVPASRFLLRDPLAVIGLEGLLPHLESRTRSMTFAVNVGGGAIPLLLVVYEISRVGSFAAEASGPGEPGNVQGTLLALCIATALNIAVSWKLARPVTGIGISVPGFVPGVLAAASALLLAAETAPPVALISGVLGPLIGAGFLRLRDLKGHPVGLQSLGGGGTFDAVLFSIVMALYLG